MQSSKNKYSERTRFVEGYVFRLDPFQDIHMMVVLFLKNEGILRATAYGAQKPTAKLGLVTRLFLYAEYLLDFSPSGIRLVECIPKDDVQDSVLSIEQLYIASIWAESIYSMHRGEEHSQQLFQLFHRAYAQLRSHTQDEAFLIHILCMWHMLRLFGIQPGLDSTEQYFNQKFLEFETTERAETIKVSRDCVKLLEACRIHRFDTVKTLQFSRSTLQEAWRIIKIILEGTLGYALKSVVVSRAVL